jgi:anaerobic selenocysteine-containing dehydrogenase
MSEKITRRDFLKLAGSGIAATAVLTGCGPAARYVVRKPYTDMPEFNQTGLNTFYATTCRECPAGCGMIVRTKEGRAVKAEGNAEHPVNRGKLCSRGLTAVQGLYNPDRIKGPFKRTKRGDKAIQNLDWDSAVKIVQDAFQQNNPASIGFLMGLAPDHLYDLISEFMKMLSGPAPVRYGALGMFEGRATLIQAAKDVFGMSSYPFFDIAGAEVVFSFGANFLETWLSPLAYSRGFSEMRKGKFGRRGHIVIFEPRMSVTSGSADEWVPIIPGSEGILASALFKRVAELKGQIASGFDNANLKDAANASGIAVEKLEELAKMFAESKSALAIPGGSAAAHANGLSAVKMILALNALVDNLGKQGGVFLLPEETTSNPAHEIAVLIDQMKKGQIKVLFIHGINPVFELPAALGFKEALANVPTVISFAPFEDETALVSDYVLPDHTPFESWGYQRMLAGSNRTILSAAQPVVVPLYNTKAAADVLLAAANGKLPYSDEVDFIQKKLVPYLQKANGTFSAPEIFTFWTQWIQKGGWWTIEAELKKPSKFSMPSTPQDSPIGRGDHLYLVVYPTQMGDGNGANRPWLQETPDPMTTVMWGSWVEINPETAKTLGIQDDDVIEISSPAGSIQTSVYLYPAIRPDTIAIPFGQGHSALGRFAAGRGCNPAAILTAIENEAGDLAYGDTLVTLKKAGSRRPLARLESRAGVYGNKH